MRLREIELEIIKEKTKQLQLELEILRLPQITAPIPTLTPMEDLVKKFLETEKIITTNSKDYIFLDDIYERLKVWLHINGYTLVISLITFRDILLALGIKRKFL